MASSHHPSQDSESLGAKLAGLLFAGMGFATASFAAFWALAFLIGGHSAAQPKVEQETPPSSAAATAEPAAEAAPPAETAKVVSADQATTPLPGFEEGKTLYSTICGVCHQPTGMGLPNMFPPLAGSDWVTASSPDRLIRIVLHGFQGPININGLPFTTPSPMMPPQGALADAQVAAVLTYIRNAFGNKASVVTAELVKAVRAAEKDRTAMWDEPSLLKIPLTAAQP